MKPTYPRILPVGEAAFTVEFGDRVDLELNRQVHALDQTLSTLAPEGLIETVPSYRALLVIYDPQRTSAKKLKTHLNQALGTLEKTALPQGKLLKIPVHYGGTDGPDLNAVAEHCHLSTEEVILRHSTPTYRVAMLGFSPGFAYLLGLPTELATPRLATPRMSVAPGSVGIAGEQTGLYALSTPGGWRIIGRTQFPLFDALRDDPFALQAGDRVRFIPHNSPTANK